MRSAWAALIFIAWTPWAPAQDIILKDGTVVTAKSLRRSGDSIMAKVALPKGGEGEVGYQLSRIDRIAFPDPEALAQARKLVGEGKFEEAMPRLATLFSQFDPYRDMPGSPWPEIAFLRATTALLAAKPNELAASAKAMASAADPLVQAVGRACAAAPLAAAGKHAEAVAMLDAVVRGKGPSASMALAWIQKGDAHLALKDGEAALRAYLHIPVFHSDQQLLVPPAMLGAARAYRQMKDNKRAEDTLRDLIEQFPASSHARAAQEELDKLGKEMTR